MVKAILIPPGSGNAMNIAHCEEIEFDSYNNNFHQLLGTDNPEKQYLLNVDEESEDGFVLYYSTLRSSPNTLANLLSDEDIDGSAILALYNDKGELEDCKGGLFFMLINHYKKRVFYDPEYFKSDISKFDQILKRSQFADLAQPIKKQKVA